MILDIEKVKPLLINSNKAIIGVSGGVDSMVLLNWLASVRTEFNCHLSVIHVNHNIHPDSNSWQNFVMSKAQNLNLPYTGISVNLDGKGKNLEYAARKARYEAFCSTGADTIILAHHANDQCENFMLKMFRGAGLRGLKGMTSSTACWFDNSVQVIRPMLSVTRSEIEAYATDNSIEYITDPSNLDPKYDRNYLRNCVWPKIIERFGLADMNIGKSINHLEEAWQLTNTLAEIDLQDVTLYDGALDWYKLKNLGYLRIKNLLLYLMSKENVYSFSIAQIEQFATGILNATIDNRHQLTVKGLTLNKIGKKILLIRITE